MEQTDHVADLVCEDCQETSLVADRNFSRPIEIRIEVDVCLGDIPALAIIPDVLDIGYSW